MSHSSFIAAITRLVCVSVCVLVAVMGSAGAEGRGFIVKWKLEKICWHPTGFVHTARCITMWVFTLPLLQIPLLLLSVWGQHTVWQFHLLLSLAHQLWSCALFTYPTLNILSSYTKRSEVWWNPTGVGAFENKEEEKTGWSSRWRQRGKYKGRRRKTYVDWLIRWRDSKGKMDIEWKWIKVFFAAKICARNGEG